MRSAHRHITYRAAYRRPNLSHIIDTLNQLFLHLWRQLHAALVQGKVFIYRTMFPNSDNQGPRTHSLHVQWNTHIQIVPPRRHRHPPPPRLSTHPSISPRSRRRASISEKKADLLSARRKKQRDEGRFQALDYFEHSKEERLTWAAVLFYNGKVDLYRSKGDAAEYWCHLEEGERARMWGLLVRIFFLRLE